MADHPSHARAREEGLGVAAGSGGRPVVASGVAIAAVGGAVLGATLVFRALNGIDNSAENYSAYVNWIEGLAVVTGAGAVSICVIGWGHSGRGVRRAARFTGWSLAAMVILWMAPVPFGIHRVLLIGSVLIGAGLFGIAGLAQVGARAGAMVPCRERPESVWLGLLMGLGAFTAAATALLVMKADALAWAHAID